MNLSTQDNWYRDDIIASESFASDTWSMKIKLDLHDIYNRGADIDKALHDIIQEAVDRQGIRATQEASLEILGPEGDQSALPSG
jgi:hypothetical protein